MEEDETIMGPEEVDFTSLSSIVPCVELHSTGVEASHYCWVEDCKTPALVEEVYMADDSDIEIKDEDDGSAETAPQSVPLIELEDDSNDSKVSAIRTDPQGAALPASTSRQHHTIPVPDEKSGWEKQKYSIINSDSSVADPPQASMSESFAGNESGLLHEMLTLNTNDGEELPAVRQGYFMSIIPPGVRPEQMLTEKENLYPFNLFLLEDSSSKEKALGFEGIQPVISGESSSVVETDPLSLHDFQPSNVATSSSVEQFRKNCPVASKIQDSTKSVVQLAESAPVLHSIQPVSEGTQSVMHLTAETPVPQFEEVVHGNTNHVVESAKKGQASGSRAQNRTKKRKRDVKLPENQDKKIQYTTVPLIFNNHRIEVTFPARYDVPKQMLEKLLPSKATHTILQSEIITENNAVELNLNILCSAPSPQPEEWLWEFCCQNKQHWFSQSIRADLGIEDYHKYTLLCEKTKIGCQAYMTLLYHARDEELTKGSIFAMRCKIMLYLGHNHDVAPNTSILNMFLEKDTRARLYQCFHRGHTAESAHHQNLISLMVQDSAIQLLKDPTVNPELNFVRCLYLNWLHNGQKPDQLLYNSDKKEAIIITPLMKRAHLTEGAGEVVFVNTVNKSGSDKSSVTFFTCLSEVGVLPLAVVIISAPKAYENLVGTYRDVIKAIGPEAFGKKNPKLILCDNFLSCRKVLKYCFPKSEVLVHTTELVQMLWNCLIFEEKIATRKAYSDKMKLLSLANDMFFATSSDTASVMYNRIYHHDLCRKYVKFQVFLETLWKEKDFIGFAYKLEKYNMVQKLGRDFVDLSHRLFLDAVVAKCNVYSFHNMADYIRTQVDHIFQKRIEECLEGATSRVAFLRSVEDYAASLEYSCTTILKAENEITAVVEVCAPHDEKFYYVNCETLTCSCSLSTNTSGFCDHLRTVCRVYKFVMPPLPDLTDYSTRKSLSIVAVGEAQHQSDENEYDNVMKNIKDNLSRLQNLSKPNQNITRLFVNKLKELNEVLTQINSSSQLEQFFEQPSSAV